MIEAAQTLGHWKASRKSVYVTDGRNMLVAETAKRKERVAIAQLIAAAPDMLAALLHVRSIIAEGAMTGFQPLEGTWAERLYASQQMTHAAVAKAEGRSP